VISVPLCETIKKNLIISDFKGMLSDSASPKSVIISRIFFCTSDKGVHTYYLIRKKQDKIIP